jgi:hypothetical protein
MNEIRGGTSVAAVNARHESWFERYSWTVFVSLSAILLLFGVTDLQGAASSTVREGAINELFIGGLSAAIAVVGLRRRQRSAWYAMALWPVWIAAQSVNAVSTGKNAEAMTGVILLVVALTGLGLAYRPAFGAANVALS